jgi:hypothetical protein
MSAWLDPAGTRGGPILSTSSSRIERYGKLTWTTMPEQLQARGITWKVYGSADGNYGDNVLPYFKQYVTNPTLAANALTPSFPGTLQTDVATGALPQVSWVLAPLIASEHPPAPVEYGEAVAAQILDTLVLDGRPVTVHVVRKASLNRAPIKLRPGAHKLTVSVIFAASTHLGPRTLHETVQGCAPTAPAPSFTG